MLSHSPGCTFPPQYFLQDLLLYSHIVAGHAEHTGHAVDGLAGAVPLPPAHGGVVESLSHTVHLLPLSHAFADQAGHAGPAVAGLAGAVPLPPAHES